MTGFYSSDQFAQLIIKYLKDEITDDENELLQQWVSVHQKRRELFVHLTNDDELQSKLIEYVAAGKRLCELVTEQVPELNSVMPISLKRHWLRLTGIAAAVIMVGFAIYLFLPMHDRTKDHKTATQQRVSSPILPGGNKAILTLADGSVIDLDKAGNGILAEQFGAEIIKSNDGELKYQEANFAKVQKQSDKVTYNTVATPRGGQFQVMLADGTKVWLNAASSIKYPTVFSGNDRRVEVSGEVYFEVSPGDLRKPFLVFIMTTDRREAGLVEVLGTHFNINAYGDEFPIVTTLMEGKIKMVNRKSAFATTSADKSSIINHQSVIICPGQQASINHKDQIKITDDVDTDAAIAWMKGFFDFHNADIRMVMKQVGRWYAVDVVYPAGIPSQSFEGNIDRNIPLNELLSLLQQMGKIKFSVNERVVKVM